MKAKLLVLALLLTAFALTSEPPAWAFTCPPNNCFDITQDCVESGGAPVPYAPGQTCIGPPHGDEYTVNFISCWYSDSSRNWTLVCYF